MKSIFFLCIGLFISSSAFAQKQDVQVYEKKEGERVIVIARNTGIVDYAVKINITSEGMDVLPSSDVEAVIPAGKMKEMATITPKPATTWSYSYDVTITQMVSKSSAKTPTATPPAPAPPKGPGTPPNVQTTEKAIPATTSLSDAAIILYAKPGCGRCTYAKKQLDELGIQYLKVDTQSNSPEVPNMWAQMKNQGFKGGSVTMPVMRVNGKYHYDIRDLQGFISKLKS